MKVYFHHHHHGDVASQISSGTNGTFGIGASSSNSVGAGGGYYGGGTSTETIKSTSNEWIYLGTEGDRVYLDDTYYVRYGAGSSWYYKWLSGYIYLNNSTFGDPCVGTVKAGYKQGVSEVNKYYSSSGSSYISGQENCIGIKSQEDLSPKVSEYSSIEDSYHYSGKYFTNTQIIPGDSSIPSRTGETVTGNADNGYAKITILSANINN